jgi:putative transposase
MKKKRYSEEQIVGILRECERQGVAETARQRGVSEQSIYRWRQIYGEMTKDQVKDYRRLVQENARLKKLLAERDLEVEVMKEIAAKKW